MAEQMSYIFLCPVCGRSEKHFTPRVTITHRHTVKGRTKDVPLTLMTKTEDPYGVTEPTPDRRQHDS